MMKHVEIVDEEIIASSGAIEAAIAAGFSPDEWPRPTLAYLGLCIDTEKLWELVERNYALEVSSGEPVASVQEIFINTIASQAECDKQALRNAALARRARELAA